MHESGHLLGGGPDSGEHGTAHDAVADVELLDLRNLRDRADVVVVEPMAGVHPQAQIGGTACTFVQLAQCRAARGAPRMGISPGVQLDRGNAERPRCSDARRIGIDEEAHVDPGVAQLPHHSREPRAAAGDVETAFGGYLLAPLRNDRRLVGPQPARERDDIGARRKLEIEDGAHRRSEALHVAVLDVAAVLAQVNGDAVGARCLALGGGGYGVGNVGSACLPQRGDVIDVHIQSQWCRVHCSAGESPVKFAATFPVRISVKHRWMIGLTLLVACGGAPATSSVAPAQTARESVDDFMQAVADSNLSKMAMLWGTSSGPAAVTGKPSDYQRRVLVMHSFLRGSTHQLGNEYPAGGDGRRTVVVRLTRDGCSYDLPVTAVRTSQYGWLVNAFDLSLVGAPGRACGPVPDSLPSPEG